MAPDPALIDREHYLRHAQWCLSLPWALWPWISQVAELAEVTSGSSLCPHLKAEVLQWLGCPMASGSWFLAALLPSPSVSAWV